MMTTANKVTIARIFLVPLFVVQALYYVDGGNDLHRLLALLAFGLATISDGLDGYIARKYNQRSELGAVLDPLADKLLLLSGLVFLTFDHTPYFDRLPFWLAGVVVTRDVVVVLGVIAVHFTCGKVAVRPHWTGKVGTVLLMATLLWTLLKWEFRFALFLAAGAAGATMLSGFVYVREGVRQLGTSPRSAPIPGQSNPRPPESPQA